MGARSSIQNGTVVHVTLNEHPTVIGEDLVVGHGAKLHGCTLEDGCLIGIGAIVLDGVIVETRAIVAAGALVAPGARIPSEQVWADNPARYLRCETAGARVSAPGCGPICRTGR